MPAKYDIGFEEALSLTLERLSPLKEVEKPIAEACGFTLAGDCHAGLPHQEVE